MIFDVDIRDMDDIGIMEGAKRGRGAGGTDLARGGAPRSTKGIGSALDRSPEFFAAEPFEAI